MLGTFFISLILLVLGTWILWFLGKTLFAQIKVQFLGKSRLKNAPRAEKERLGKPLRKAGKRLLQIDKLFEEKKFFEAISLIEEAIIFTPGARSQDIARSKEHHQEILSRLLTLSDGLGSRLENIASIEKLFLERSEIQHMHLKASGSYKSFQKKRRDAGKDVPDWSKAEFEQRVSEVKKELEKNTKDLKEELRLAFDSLRAAKDKKVIYH